MAYRRIKRKVDPLVEQGRKVFVAYTNERAFETRQRERSYGPNGAFTYKVTRNRLPSADLLAWMEANAGPRGILWTTEKVDDGINLYFAVPSQAMMFKLAWGGQ